MKRFFTYVAAALLTGVAAHSQSLHDENRDSINADHRIIVLDDVTVTHERVNADSMRRVISNFYYDQFHAFSDPESPYFMFMSRDASLAMGIGGAVRMRGYYDWNGAMPIPGFAPMFIPMNPEPEKMRHFGTTPAGTCLFFRVLGRNKSLGNYQLYIEANFSGYEARDFKLQKAYAIVNDFTIGYATSTFSDPMALPPTVDAQGASNKIANTNVLVRWMPMVAKNLRLAVSAETPATQIEASAGNTKPLQDWLPDAAAFIQYEWGPTSHVRLSGVVRSLSYRDLVQNKNHYEAGWGVLLSSVAHPTRFLTSYVTLNYGHGYGSLTGDLMMGNYDLIGDTYRPGRLYSPASLGFCVGLQWNIRRNLFVCGAVSQTQIYARNRQAIPDDYRRGMVADVNCFWNMTSRIMLGAEFDWGRRWNNDGAARNAFRVGALAMFSF